VTDGGKKPKLTFYDRGHTIVYASRFDPRFSYSAYVPSDYDDEGSKTYPLAIAVHGTTRATQRYRDAFVDFAEANGVIVMVPLFPANITRPGDINSYKMLRAGELHYDAVMIDMIAEMHERYRIFGDKVLMYGFSGGAQFVHRFMYLHPERLMAMSIGSPGVVTLLDPTRPFWVGVKDFEAVFGRPLDLGAIRKVPVHMIVGAEDKNTWEITIKPGDRWWMEEANLAGVTRIDRLQSLKESFLAQGIDVQFDLVPGVAHKDPAMMDAVKLFFTRALNAARPKA
jgi:pimeloyl-ACP methyl ester carboxylesterase